MTFLKTDGDVTIKEFTGTADSKVYSVSKNGDVINTALLAVNGDSGTVTVKQRIKGEATWRELTVIDLSTTQGNLNSIHMCGTYIEYMISLAGCTNTSCLIPGAKEV